MTTKPIGLYVHIPFCVRKCNYCDFCSFPVDSIPEKAEYLAALCREIESYRDREIHIDSIFFGGGTPSLLTPEEMEGVVLSIKKSFVLSSDIEFTVEANPKTLDEKKLLALVRLGVNRLSIGLQSIHENEQKILGRIHNYDDFAEMYTLARRCGIENVNVDLMYGIPEQTMDSFAKTLSSVAELSPEHISLYGLILEEGTPFYERQDGLSLPSEDAECDMYYYAGEFLHKKGYSHYEISNYAKAGRECRHNLKYWRDEEYIGVGPSAYSYFEGKRFGNTRDLREYIDGNCAKYDSEEIIDKVDEAYEFVMLGLRLAEGFSLDEYKRKFGIDFEAGREEILEKFAKEGYLTKEDGRLSLTERGFYVSNTIINELI